MKELNELQTVMFDNYLVGQRVFEDSLSLKSRQSRGVFLTEDSEIINSITSIFKTESILSKTLLEPSCGGGVFLVNLMLYLHSIGISAQEVREYFQYKVFFCDIDSSMLLECEKNLESIFLELFEDSIEINFNSICCDFTKAIDTKDSLDKRSALLGKVDIIIGNPPFVTLYGRRDKKESESQRQYFLDNFSQFPRSLKNGKLNLSMMFIENAFKLLSPQGNLAYVLDISFFEQAFDHTRHFILKNFTVSNIELGYKGFKAASGQIVLKLKKENPAKGAEVLVRDISKGESVVVKQSKWLTKENGYKFIFHFNPLSENLLKKIEESNVSILKKLYPEKNLRTCCMLLDMEDKFTFEKSIQQDLLNDDLIFPYYEGSKGLPSRFSKFSYKKKFYYNKILQDEINDKLKIELHAQGIKNKKRIGLGETSVYLNPKIFIRQSCKEIIASFDESKSAANNSLYVFTLRSNLNEDVEFLKFLTGYLNSRFLSFYCQVKGIIRFTPGKQPQIKLSDLYQIPIPLDMELRKKVLIEVEALAKKEIEVNAGIAKIDELIFNNFNLSIAERDYIISSYENFLKV